MIISEFKIPDSSPATPKTGLGTAVNFESVGAGICPAGDSSSGIDVIDADVNHTCDEDCSIEGPKYVQSFACWHVCRPNPCFALTVRKCCKECQWSVGLSFKLQRD